MVRVQFAFDDALSDEFRQLEQFVFRFFEEGPLLFLEQSKGGF